MLCVVEQIVEMTYQYIRPFGNWPRELRLAQEDEEITHAHVCACKYMLFLKRRADGRYEPVSGRIDPARTVRVLYEEQLLPTTER